MTRFTSFVLILAACGQSMGGNKSDGQPSTVDAPSTTHLDPNKCAAFAQSMATAATTCGTPLPAGAQAQVEQWCRKGVTVAAMCGGDPAAGLDCFATSATTNWVCQLGQPYPYCNGDLAAALGAYCLMASGNPACASGITCAFDADCSGDSVCNSATKQCMQKNAYCIGLPCSFDVDCPSGEKCNSAEHACVGN
jgi:hypothetical protein